MGPGVGRGGVAFGAGDPDSVEDSLGVVSGALRGEGASLDRLGGVDGRVDSSGGDGFGGSTGLLRSGKGGVTSPSSTRNPISPVPKVVGKFGKGGTIVRLALRIGLCGLAGPPPGIILLKVYDEKRFEARRSSASER